MVTVCIITFGCKVNQCDGEEMARHLQAWGHQVVGGWQADAFVVNTCTVTSTADAKARKLIHRIARERPEALLVVTGCYAERDPEGLGAIPGVDVVVPSGGKAAIGEMLAGLRQDPRRPEDRAPTGEDTQGKAEASRQAAGMGMPALQHVRAFVKVQDGCDHRCAYCVVPNVRGAPVSKPLAQVMDELGALAACPAREAGTPEVVLCGIRLGAYGSDLGGVTLAELLHAARETGIPRIRLSSLEPMDVSDELIAEIADHPTLCHHLHVPLQSGDDEVLEAMVRDYTAKQFSELVAKVRRAWPDAAISTDVMVGFPGESSPQFANTETFLREVGFSRLHVFPFSARPGTAAAERRDQITAGVKRTRAERLLALNEELMQKAAEAWVGREVDALIEERGRDGLLIGWTEQYIRVRCEGPEGWIGRIVEMTASEARGGELAGEPSRRRRLAEEAARLDLAEERALAEEGLDQEEWPEY